MDTTFETEQAHLTETYAKLVSIHDALAGQIETMQRDATQDLKDMSEEVRIDFGGADETIETLAAIETLNSVIDTYNQYHDFTVEKLKRVSLLLRQPYFAKVRLKMRPGRPARDVYIGTAGITDEHKLPLIVDWRSPIAETYYNQENGETSYEVDGRRRTVFLELRRQFDITRDHLNMYFDTTVAIEDSLLLNALKKHHTEKLQAITATIQHEQNEVVRHADVPVLLVSGIAGSGKTSVLLQRIAYVFYHERKTLSPDQVFLFTPNQVFESYVDTVLPTLGESNPLIFTWRSFLASLGLADHGTGKDVDPAELAELEHTVQSMTVEDDDLRAVKVDDLTVLKVSQVASAIKKYSQFPVGPKLVALVKDELHDKVDRRLTQMSKDEEVQEKVLGLDIEEQVEIFGRTISPSDEEETAACTLEYLEHRYSSAHDEVEKLSWLRIDRIGMRVLHKSDLSAAEWVYLKILISGSGDKNARYVMVDEVQDYTATQLMVLARYFSRAHFLLLGDEHQAIQEGTATFPQIRDIFASSHGEVEECQLLTSYRSSPEITELFCSLLDADERRKLTSVHRPGVAPKIVECADRDSYLDELRRCVDEARGEEGLTAIVADNAGRVNWLSKQLGDGVPVMGRGEKLPAAGIVLMDLPLAKGLEFDHVIVPDAQAETYPDTPLARRRLYTAISRAMHQVTLVSQGELSPLLPRVGTASGAGMPTAE